MHAPTYDILTAAAHSNEGLRYMLAYKNEVMKPVKESIVDSEASVPAVKEGAGRYAGCSAPEFLCNSDDTI